MSSSSQGSLQKLARLVRAYRIEFVHDLPQNEWPESLQKLRKHVFELGEKKFDSYATRPDSIDDEPWKLEVKSVAKKLAEKASRCVQRNESSWRAACEHVVFSRLSAEVACRKCRNRVWRSEIEAEPPDQSTSTDALRRRQQSRQPCRCPRADRPQDYQEANGINNIFGHREDEAVRLDPRVSKQLSKDLQKPDKVVGLRQTRNIENLLYDTTNVNQQGSEQLQVQELLSQPLNHNGDKLLFPFLVLEAKSGVSGTDWHSIQLQTAFPIRKFLETQDQLLCLTRAISDRRFEPTVWFLCNKGEDWRLSIAFIQRGMRKLGAVGKIDCKVIQVWGGSITNLNGALQLLLLVDYMVDWARDVYREDIIRHLRILASDESDAATITNTDTDIISLSHALERLHTEEVNTDNQDIRGAYDHYLERFATPRTAEQLLCRSANYIKSAYYATIITRDNLEISLNLLLQHSQDHLLESIRFAMVDPLLVDGETITALEEQWTGYPRRTTFCQSFPATLFTVIGFVTYLDEDWHLVRELQVLALENDEMVLRRILGGAQNLHPFPVLRATMLQALKDMYAGTSSDILREAIVRRCFVLVPKRRCGESADTPFPGLYITGILDDGRLCGCTHTIFRAFRGDYADSEHLFLRYSRRIDAQDRLHNKHGLPIRWLPFSTILSQASNLWVHSYSRWDQPRMCLYFLNQDPTAIPYSELEEHAAWTFEALDVFHTIRGCDRRDFTAFETGIQWNLKKTVGISLPSITDFPRLKRLPTLFGCRGIGLTSGQLVYYRTLEPWLDPRLSVPDPEDRHFLQYKIVMQHTLHWMTTAQKRLDEGIACCLWAGFINALPICDWCQNGLWNSIELSRELLCLSVTFSVLSEHLASHVGTVFDILRSYPRIDDPFEDLGHLQRQYHEFRLWRAGEREEGIRRRGKYRLFEV